MGTKETKISKDSSSPFGMSKVNKVGRKETAHRDSLPGDSKSSYGLFLPDMRMEWEKLRSNFLKSERNYCKILECLKEDYSRELSILAIQRKIKMTLRETTSFFKHIPKLLKFHKTFYSDLLTERNVGKMFVRLLNYFKWYGDYMKDCVPIVHVMGVHISDERLWNRLVEIRKRSRCCSMEFTDLLISPLNRIEDYKIFLDMLYQMADSAQSVDYAYLGKAARRIGRVANYIGEYKYGIINKIEMNRVQLYLGSQCSILAPHRKIIRRGQIVRRTTSWPSRNKTCFFFLFNDVLLWTSLKAQLQKVVRLRHCTLWPSTSKTNRERKFRIHIDMEKNTFKGTKKWKTLLLECKSRRQRDEWWQVIEKEIEAQARASKRNLIIPDPHLIRLDDSEENEAKGTSKVTTPVKVSTSPAIEDMKNSITSVGGLFGVDDKAVNCWVPVMEDSLSYFEHSANFRSQTLKDFGPMDDGESQTSDHDKSFFEKHAAYKHVHNAICLLSPQAKQEEPAHRISLTSSDNEESVRYRVYNPSKIRRSEQIVAKIKSLTIENESPCRLKLSTPCRSNLSIRRQGSNASSSFVDMQSISSSVLRLDSI